ncbi:MAG: ATP-dependent Clp protease proteolytic subunit [Lachnospiraceae bacterium]|nr:ATP-dependent Clp protease proteolytic subunit [Lachnospiraceae bacterium]
MDNEEIKEYGITENDGIQMISIIGEIEGHDCLSQNAKTTKYEHLLPLLAQSEQSNRLKGILFLINTVGGDVSCGLALAEMIASLSKPTVSLILGDSHSIGVPMAVATDYSFIVPSATMIIHPVRMSGMVLGTPQTYSQFQQIQDRILDFIASHSQAEKKKLEELMMNTSMLSKDLGTVLVGKDAVVQGLVQEVGGISRALAKLQSMVSESETQNHSIEMEF